MSTHIKLCEVSAVRVIPTSTAGEEKNVGHIQLATFAKNQEKFSKTMEGTSSQEYGMKVDSFIPLLGAPEISLLHKFVATTSPEQATIVKKKRAKRVCGAEMKRRRKARLQMEKLSNSITHYIHLEGKQMGQVPSNTAQSAHFAREEVGQVPVNTTHYTHLAREQMGQVAVNSTNLTIHGREQMGQVFTSTSHSTNLARKEMGQVPANINPTREQMGQVPINTTHYAHLAREHLGRESENYSNSSHIPNRAKEQMGSVFANTTHYIHLAREQKGQEFANTTSSTIPTGKQIGQVFANPSQTISRGIAPLSGRETSSYHESQESEDVCPGKRYYSYTELSPRASKKLRVTIKHSPKSPKTPINSKTTLNSSLRVAVIDTANPFGKVDEGKAALIMNALDEKLYSVLAALNGEEPPIFTSRTHAGEILRITCFNERSHEWLKVTVDDLRPWDGARLKVVQIDKLPRLTKVSVFIPEDGKVFHAKEATLLALGNLNPKLNIAKWCIFHHKVSTKPPKGQLFVFGVGQEDIRTLKENGCKLFYAFQTLRARVKGEINSVEEATYGNEDAIDCSAAGNVHHALS